MNLRRKGETATVREELVKYMSKLPSYLERGDRHHEKILNVGVLDWRRLEIWHSSQTLIHTSGCRRPSDVSSSPNCQATRRRTLQHHLLSCQETFPSKQSLSNENDADRGRELSRPSSPIKSLGDCVSDSAAVRRRRFADPFRGGSHHHGIQIEKRVESPHEAILQVSMKNGQPFFTFAAINEANILMASCEADYGSNYTFFSVPKTKKEGRMNPENGPKIVAQLKVSGSQISSGGELVLESVPQNNELAAAFLKTSNDHRLVAATVILPNGIHNVPRNGTPFSLLQRWRTGGSCDCGGWDEGCNFRILNNRGKPFGKSGCSVELFMEGGEERDSVFKMSPLKDGMHAVEFDLQITVMQAFMVCIAISEGEKLLEKGPICRYYNESLWLREDDEDKGNNKERKIPAKFVPYPPISPIGRA